MATCWVDSPDLAVHLERGVRFDCNREQVGPPRSPRDPHQRVEGRSHKQITSPRPGSGPDGNTHRAVAGGEIKPGWQVDQPG